MRIYPKDSYDMDELQRLNAEPWMIELLRCNPSYPFWGNHEDYMIRDEGDWSSRQTIPSVSELWKLNDYNEVVNFYFELIRDSHECKACEGSGLNPETLQLKKDWYDFDDTGRRWDSNLVQEEVDALWDNHRLSCDFESKPTAAEVNTWNRGRGIGHDAINQWICVETRAKRLGIWGECRCCNGTGHIFDADKAHVELQLWVLHPRIGASRGLRVTNVEKSDVPRIVQYLKEARQRNDDKFSKISTFTLS